MLDEKFGWPHVEISGFDAGLTEEQQSIQQTVHRFAAKVMRPLGRELDRLPADQAYAPGSPFWDFQKQISELGVGPEALHGLELPQKPH